MLDAHDLYLAATTAKTAKKPRRLTYRCESHHCMLLDVVDAGPLGVVLHIPQYKYSNKANDERSSESGRKANTVDGDRRWKAHTFYLEQSALTWEDDMIAGQSLSCNHVLDYTLNGKEFQDDLGSSKELVRIRTNHTRYAV
ncbi:hypothetical protein ACTXPG_14195 [Glutamicibacter arilaitensis]|uniref:hypothetical protein n=1 Tax=Glutamicibacter arilaitensis TaxID=256701 RepID=UPI003FD36FDB